MTIRQTICWLAAMLFTAPVSWVYATSDTPPALAEHLTPVVGQAEANGITLAYESFGPPDRETILWIAGTGQQLTSWPMELLEALVTRGYRIVRFDNRDSGLSTMFDEAGVPDAQAVGAALAAGEPPPLPYTLRDMARDAVGLLDALGIPQAHLVGVSMGGAIAQYVAIDFPERTLSLTSVMANSGNPALPVVADPERFMALPTPPADDPQAYIDYQVKVHQLLNSPAYPSDEATLREWVTRDVARSYNTSGLARQQLISIAGHFEHDTYRLRHLETIKVPTVVLHGADDPLVPVVSAEDLAARIPGAVLCIVPGMGHDLPVALVPLFADAITAAATGTWEGFGCSSEP
jgi:pimeloyl-ACP methyl ester carboxylesterase